MIPVSSPSPGGDRLRGLGFRRQAPEERIETLEAALTAAGLPLPDEGHVRSWRLMSDDELFEGAARLAED